jgi:hypothetical protein
MSPAPASPEADRPRLSVGLLQLRASPVGAEQAPDFAEMVVRALGRHPLPVGLGGTLERLTARIPGQPGEPPERLAERIAEAVIARAVAEIGVR